MTTVEFNAEGKVLGRLSSEIAKVLRGKTSPSFRPDRLAEVKVTVRNVAKIHLTGRKLEQKIYYKFSGYPGGLKQRRANEKLPSDMLRLAVKRMLPANKLRAKIMKRLIIE